MNYAIVCALFLPLIGFLFLTATSGIISRALAGIIACSTVLIAFLFFALALYIYTSTGMSPEKITLYNWVPVKGIDADFSLRIDPLSLFMTLVITGVGFLIHVYSNGYVEHEEDYPRYFAFLNFFVFSMLLLVMAGHLLVLFVGWEGVGLASYLLIGYWYTRPSAAQAATKAFVVNRIGDFGLLIGLLLTFHLFGTGDIAEISQRAGKEFPIGAPVIGLLTLLYFVGATGKSAQLPLHTWLPDAMEGPTPVSALIHAATMVTAGVYLVVRLHPLYLLAPGSLHLVGAIGGATALFAALCALSQTDLKRVLAYSTISQLGLMFLACGVAAFYAAIFHLMTHAFVKALLFLSAGNVVHMMHGTTDMNKMGGLSKIFTKTHWLFLIGVLAMSGVPPLAAFFSKDLILEEEHLAGFHTWFYIGLTVSLLTAFYLTRAYCLTFMGPTKLEGKILKATKEAPAIMLVPVSILAFLSIVGGFLGFCMFCKTPALEGFLEQVGVTIPGEEEINFSLLMTKETFLSIAAALGGVGSAYWVYTRYAEKLGPPVQMFRKSFYVDEIYDSLLTRPLKAVSKFIERILEPKVFDEAIRITVQTTQSISGALQQVQSGQIRSYVAWFVIGSVLLVAYLVF